MGRPKKEAENGGQVEVLNEVMTTLRAMNERLNNLEKPKEEAPKITTTVQNQNTVTQTIESKIPVPVDYRKAVDTILNPSFGIEILPMADAPAFQFAVLVPEKYSNAGKAYLDMYKRDVRPKVITYAEGAKAVSEWCELIYKNLPPETQSMITADRFSSMQNG